MDAGSGFWKTMYVQNLVLVRPVITKWTAGPSVILFVETKFIVRAMDTLPKREREGVLVTEHSPGEREDS